MEIDLSGLQEEGEGERRDLLDDALAVGGTFDWISPLIGWGGELLRGWVFFNLPGDMIWQVSESLAAAGVDVRNEMLIGFEPGSRYTFYVSRRQARRARRVLRSLGLVGGNI